MIRSWIALGLALQIVSLFFGSPPAARSETAGKTGEIAPPALEQMIAEALEKSAELAALREQIRAAEAMIAPVGALPDPMASIERMPMREVDVGLSQGMPGAGKRRLSREVQREEVSRLRAEYAEKRNHLVRQVKQAYYAVQYLDEALEIAEKSKTLAEDLLKTAEAMYATGKGLQQDVFSAQVQLSRMVEMLVVMRRERSAAAARLNGLLYRPPSQSIPRLPRLAASVLPLDAERLQRRSKEENPRLLEVRAAAAQAEKREELAARGLRPDFMFMLKYRIRESALMESMGGGDPWSASVGMSLPWLFRREKVDKEVEAAGAELKAARMEVSAAENNLASGIEEMVLEIRRSEEQIALLDSGLLPQAEGAFASSLTAYATGRVDFLTVLENQMNLYNLQVERAGLVAQHEKGLAEVEYLVGGPLEEPNPADREVSDNEG
jgi:outer membrane protein TolC